MTKSPFWCDYQQTTRSAWVLATHINHHSAVLHDTCELKYSVWDCSQGSGRVTLEYWVWSKTNGFIKNLSKCHENLFCSPLQFCELIFLLICKSCKDVKVNDYMFVTMWTFFFSYLLRALSYFRNWIWAGKLLITCNLDPRNIFASTIESFHSQHQ